jgi:hypothetical protein
LFGESRLPSTTGQAPAFAEAGYVGRDLNIRISILISILRTILFSKD